MSFADGAFKLSASYDEDEEEEQVSAKIEDDAAGTQQASSHAHEEEEEEGATTISSGSSESSELIGAGGGVLGGGGGEGGTFKLSATDETAAADSPPKPKSKPTGAPKYVPGGFQNKCPKCKKTVYKMEEFLFGDASWHKTCFCCGGTGKGGLPAGCNRVLAHGDFKSNEGVAYCNACFARLFVQAGARGAMLTSTYMPPPISPNSFTKAPSSSSSSSWSSSSSSSSSGSGSGSGDAMDEMSVTMGGINIADRASVFRMSGTGGEDEADAIAARARRPSASAASDKFAALAAENKKCQACSKTVYKAEEHVFEGASWHKTCFCCGGTGELGCKRVVANTDFKSHAGMPYCAACFARLFMIAGARGATLATGL